MTIINFTLVLASVNFIIVIMQFQIRVLINYWVLRYYFESKLCSIPWKSKQSFVSVCYAYSVSTDNTLMLMHCVVYYIKLLKHKSVISFLAAHP
jgi:hypothetical protein